ncbi:MAG: hypothetical protein ACI4A8_05015 [Muribaculaceae bacterium]
MFCIIDHIEYLIQRHECVVIPNWGAFIVHTEHSLYDVDNECITLPCRSLGFNPALTYNDGMLVSSIMRKEGISYEKANSIVDDEVKALLIQLHSDGEMSMGRIGSFGISTDNVIVYRNDSQIEWPVFFGLQSLNISKLDNRKVDDEIEDEEVNDGRMRIVPVFGRVLRYAAMLLFMLTLLFTLSTPVPVDMNDSQLASLNIIKTDIETRNRIASYNGALSISLPTESVAVVCEKSGQIPLAEAVVAQEDDVTDKYCVIIASLPSLEAATKHIGRCAEKNLRIVEKSGKYRVCIYSSNDMSQALDYMNKVRDKYSDAWIMRN